VNAHQNKLLNFALIILFMIAPLRSVFATQLMACDMEVTQSPVTVGATSSAEHCRQVMGDLPMGNVSADSISADSVHGDHQAKNCCNGNGACMSDCHFAISASLFIQNADYSPALLNTDIFDSVSSTLLVRELNPPSRPPLSLYS
jgi:hypothetical protein